MLYPRPTYPVPPDDDDFDEAYETQREAERDGGEGAVPPEGRRRLAQPRGDDRD